MDILTELDDFELPQPGYIIGKTVIFGVPHHVEMIKVFEAPTDKFRLQHASDPDLDRSVCDIIEYSGEDELQTVKVPGHEGDWIVIITPHSR